MGYNHDIAADTCIVYSINQSCTMPTTVCVFQFPCTLYFQPHHVNKTTNESNVSGLASFPGCCSDLVPKSMQTAILHFQLGRTQTAKSELFQMSSKCSNMSQKAPYRYMEKLEINKQKYYGSDVKRSFHSTNLFGSATILWKYGTHGPQISAPYSSRVKAAFHFNLGLQSYLSKTIAEMLWKSDRLVA